MLHSPVLKFETNMRAYSKKQAERFHQDIIDFKHRYQSLYNKNMMRGYIWSLMRKSNSLNFFYYFVFICNMIS